MVARPRYWWIFVALLPVAIVGNALRFYQATEDLELAEMLAHGILAAVAGHAMWIAIAALRGRK